jgi:Protein of unknown function (DUF2630)
MAAGAAHAQVDPSRADRQTILTARNTIRPLDDDLVQMLTDDFVHGGSPASVFTYHVDEAVKAPLAPSASVRGMNDESILSRIESLVDEEHELLRREEADVTRDEELAEDRGRLERISVELDRCWDLLRQRRARRDAGQDPDEAHVRDADTVERYWQ